jgi:hypothetical protein
MQDLLAGTAWEPDRPSGSMEIAFDGQINEVKNRRNVSPRAI